MLKLEQFNAYRAKPFSEKTMYGMVKSLAAHFKDVNVPNYLDDTLIGVEVEVEGITEPVTFKAKEGQKEFWQVKEDGSLRNHGAEFITVPIAARNFPIILEELKHGLIDSKSKFEFSPRTSIHVHMNVRDMTIEQVISLLVTYIAVERLLYRYVKDKNKIERAENIFCLPINQTYYVSVLGSRFVDIRKHIQYEDEMRIINEYKELINDWKKYLGFNLLRSLEATMGTAEFRQMAGTIDHNILVPWIGLLLKLKKYAMNNPLENIIKDVEDLNTNSAYDAFISSVFGELTNEVYSSNYKKHIEDNVAFLKMCFAYEESMKIVDEYRSMSYAKFDKTLMAKYFVAKGVKFQSAKAVKPEAKEKGLKELLDAQIQEVRGQAVRDRVVVNRAPRR